MRLSFDLLNSTDLRISTGLRGPLFAVWLAVLWTAMLMGPALLGLAQSQADHQEASQWFESRIRPILLEHCLECHASDTEASGGLLLDSRDGWEAGGDSGAAIVAGEAAASRVLAAMGYANPRLQMPPSGKLPAHVIRDFQVWIDAGAFDPRQTGPVSTEKQSGLSVEAAQDHWAYRPVLPVSIPELANSKDSDSTVSLSGASPIDAFLDAKRLELGLTATASVSHDVLARRLYFDLLGLPPTMAQQHAAVELLEQGEAGYTRLVDQLLAAPQFGEHFARKWMDVARYADSITLRGFVLPQAWRYRDYLIESFSSDRPFDQMIREQVAGDLLPASNLTEQQRQCVATGFLVLGNTNLEQQDKTQLEMDVIDEQLEVMGRAFLGQTIGCARCHDHKFDPIPTRDYYALAGILRSADSLEHDNVSKWIERSLPASAADVARYDQLKKMVDNLQVAIHGLQQLTGQTDIKTKKSVPINELAGCIVDNSAARLVGNWTLSTSVGKFVASNYAHDGQAGQGTKTATFEAIHLSPGSYEVRLSYTPGENRASNTKVHVFSADGEACIVVDQRPRPPVDGLWLSLGTYRFEEKGQAFVMVSNEAADGHVIIDAVQFLPLSAANTLSANTLSADNLPASVRISNKAEDSDEQELAERSRELQRMQVELSNLQQRLESRPTYLTLVEKSPAQDVSIHIRGDVHNLGATVPRGFLTALGTLGAPPIAADSSGRVELAHWLSASDNPLTGRVYVNRVWSWLMGQGIVASTHNFGTTGLAPTHPELLDWLATQLTDHRWSTKHMVRLIVHSQAYRRSVTGGDAQQLAIDPSNRFYWRGQSRRLSVEALRDAMLQVSGELDSTPGGSLIAAGTVVDYHYAHRGSRRSVYQPVFRNALPELFEAFDFADPSTSLGTRPRSTVSTQALTLLNHPWVVARASACAERLRREVGIVEPQAYVQRLYGECLGRAPTQIELASCLDFLQSSSTNNVDSLDQAQLAQVQLAHALMASLDFRYLK